MEDYNFLKRYTDIPSIIYLLKNRAITMLDPKLWDDKNDTYYLEKYKTVRSLKSLLVLCFTEAAETYHHWKVYSGGKSGVCITFNREKLCAILNKDISIKHQAVRYLTLPEIKNNSISRFDLPFVKRYGFLDEKEYRIVYECIDESKSTKDIEIPLSCIERITMNPWIEKALSDTLKDTIHSFDGCKKIKLTKSSLIDNKVWKNRANFLRTTNCSRLKRRNK